MRCHPHQRASLIDREQLEKLAPAQDRYTFGPAEIEQSSIAGDEVVHPLRDHQDETLIRMPGCPDLLRDPEWAEDRQDNDVQVDDGPDRSAFTRARRFAS